MDGVYTTRRFTFKNSKLCIPKCSMRENLIQEKHNGGMEGHFGSDKPLDSWVISIFGQG